MANPFDGYSDEELESIASGKAPSLVSPKKTDDLDFSSYSDDELAKIANAPVSDNEQGWVPTVGRSLASGAVGGTVQGTGGVVQASEELTGQSAVAGMYKAGSMLLGGGYKYLNKAINAITGLEAPDNKYDTVKNFFDKMAQDTMERDVPGVLDTSIADLEEKLGFDRGFLGKAIAGKGKQWTEALAPEGLEPGSAKYQVAGALTSVGMMVPAVAAGILTKNPNTTLEVMAAMSGGQDYAEKRADGMDVPTALGSAVLNRATEKYTEKIPLGVLFNKNYSIGKRLLMSAVTDIPGEEVATAIESGLIETATTNPNKTWGEFLTDMKDTAIQSAIMSGTMGLGMHPVVKWAEKQENRNRSQDIQNAVDANGHLELGNDDLINVFREAETLAKNIPDDTGLAGSIQKIDEELQKRGVFTNDPLSMDIETKLAELDEKLGGTVAESSDLVRKTEGGDTDAQSLLRNENTETQGRLQTETEGQVTEPTIPQGEDIITEPPTADTSKEIASSPSSFFSMPEIGTQEVKEEKTPSTLPLTELSEEGVTNPPSTPEKTSQEATQKKTPVSDGFKDGKIKTLSGRVLTPPVIRTSSKTVATKDSKKADEWLRREAIEEAKAKGDEFAGDQFKMANPTKMTQAEREGMHDYLFGETKNIFVLESEKPLKKKTKSATKILKVFPDKENGLEVHVAKVAKGFSVAVMDVDSGKFFDEVKIYPTDKKAIEAAKAIIKKPKPEKKSPPTVKKSLTVQKELTLESYVRKHKINFNIPGHTSQQANADGLLSYSKNDGIGLDRAAEELQGLGLLGATPDKHPTAGDYLYAELQKIVYNRINKKAQSLTAEEDQAIKEFKEEMLNEGYSESEAEGEVGEDQRTGKKEAYSVKDSEAHGEAQSFLEEDDEFVKEEETPSKELFDTSSMFTLSGSQPVEQKTMKVPEKKGERLFDVEKQTTDELKDRLSGEKAKREFEEGKKTASLKVVVDDIATAEALLEQKEAEYYDAEESGKSPEELRALWDSATAQKEEVYRLRRVRIREDKLKLIKDKERKLADIEQKTKDGEKIYWSKDWEPDTRVRSIVEARQEIQNLKDDTSLKVGTVEKGSLLSPEESQALVSDILSILADGSTINFVGKIDPNRPDIQKALTQWKQGNPGASFVIEGMHRKVIVDGNTMASIIEVSMGSSDIRQTAWHEAWHSIDEIFLTANEKKILAEKLTPDIERQADIFAKYAANQKHLLPKSAKPIFERIREFFEKVGNYLKDRGFTSADDVFNRALRGELKERTKRWMGEGQTAFKMGNGKFNAAFRKWFGNSKVVDENGEPLVVYHGTQDDIDSFDLNHPYRKDTGWLGNGVYLTTSTDLASSYSRLKVGSSDANVMPLYVKLENPYYATLKDKQRLQTISHNEGIIVGKEASDAWTEELKSQGYDGVILQYEAKDVGEKLVSKEIVAFNPSAVKSVFNQGTWDKNDPRISFKITPVIKNLIDRNAKKAADPEKFPLPIDKEFRRLYNEAMGKDYSKAQAYTLTPSYKAYGPNARPEWTANYENFKGAREERQTLNSEFMRKIDNFLNAKADKVVNVEKVFFEGDATLGQKIRDLYHEARQVKLGGNLELSKQLRERAKAIKILNRYSDEELANGVVIERTGEVVKLNPEEIAMYKELRDGYDYFLRYLLENMAKVAFDKYSKAPWFTSMVDLFNDVTLRQTPEQRKTLRTLNKLALNKIRGKKAETIQKNRAALMDIVKEHIATVSGITDQAELSTMTKEMVGAYKKERVSINAIKKARNRIGQITAYAPRVREQAKAYFNIYKTVKSMSKDGQEKITKELVANYVIEEKAIYKLKPDLRAQAIREMWEDYKSRHKNEDLSYKVDRVTRESDTSYRGVNDMNLQRIIDNAITSIKGTKNFVDGPVLDGLKNSLVQAVANEMKVRGFGRSLVSRKLQHIEGYKTTGLQKITVDYITGLTGMITKQKSALRAYDILKTVPKKDTVLYEDMAKYTQDMLRNQNGMDRASGKAKGLLFTWYLSGLLKMVPIQLTQNYATGMPILAQKMREWGVKGLSEARYHKAMADATTIRVDKKTGEVKQNKRINELEARLLTESLHNGNTADQYVRYITGLLDTQMSRKATWLLEKLSRPFSMMETFNRESAALSMFRMAWEHYSKTIPDLEERYQAAKHEASVFVSGTHFDFGKENLPRLATGGDAMSIGVKTLMTFRSFNHNYVQFIFGSKDWKTIAHSLAYIALFGGMMGLPFIKDILDILEKLTGKSYTKSAREVMRKFGGKTLETFGIQGLPALAGANISGSLAMGIPFADWMTGGSASSTVFGVVGGMGEKIAKGINYGLKGELYRAGESLAPEMLASPMKAMRTSEIGKEYLGTTGYDTTSKGKPKFDENGKPLSMDTGDVIAKMMGFNPSGYSMKTEAQRSASNIEEYFSDWYTKIRETYRAGRTNHDPKTIAKALRQIREFNQAIVDKEVVGLIPRIKMSNVVKAAKMEMTKKQKREAQYKRNYLAS